MCGVFSVCPIGIDVQTLSLQKKAKEEEDEEEEEKKVG